MHSSIHSESASNPKVLHFLLSAPSQCMLPGQCSQLSQLRMRLGTRGPDWYADLFRLLINDSSLRFSLDHLFQAPHIPLTLRYALSAGAICGLRWRSPFSFRYFSLSTAFCVRH